MLYYKALNDIWTLLRDREDKPHFSNNYLAIGYSVVFHFKE